MPERSFIEKIKNRAVLPFIYTVIVLVSVVFTCFIIRAVCINDCLGIKEQYMRIEAGEAAREIAAGVNLGRDIYSFYGLGDLCAETVDFEQGSADCLILDSTGEIVEYTFKGQEDEAEKLAYVFDETTAELVKKGGGSADIGKRRIMLEPIGKDGAVGYVMLMFDRDALTDLHGLNVVDEYRSALAWTGALALDNLNIQVEKLRQKGVKTEDILEMRDYYNELFSDYGIVESVSLTTVPPNADEYVLTRESFDGFYVSLTLSRSYISDMYLTMALTAAAAFVVCLMIILELIGMGRMAVAKKNDAASSTAAVPYYVRFFTFFMYLAIYVSLPYCASIITEWGESILGISNELLSSFPVAALCIGLVISQIVGEKLIARMPIGRYTLLALLVGTVPAVLCAVFFSVPALVLCSLCFGLCSGLQRYLMNYVISVCSDGDKDVSQNFGFYNAGLLSGLTLGGSLGGIVVQAVGYRGVYFASALIMAVLSVVILLLTPYSHIAYRGKTVFGNTVGALHKAALKIIKSPLLFINLLVTQIPLNLGLMFIVAFMPVFIGSNNLPSVTGSYAYLMYGFAGSYLGVVMLRLLKGMNINKSAFIGMLLIGVSAGVLMFDVSVKVLLIAALFAGLFDGFGSAAVTGVFVGCRKAAELDRVALLTLSSITGNLVSAFTPFIYSFIINDGNQKVNLACLFVFFAVSGLFMLNIKVKE